MNEQRVRKQYLPIVRKLGSKVVSSHAIHRSLCLHRGRTQVYFAPFTPTSVLLSRLKTARVLFLGLTPGMQQAEAAFQQFFDPQPGNPVSFKGSMRTNLCKYMDDVGLADALRIAGTEDLFDDGAAGRLATSTSLLRYPVFRQDGSNYSGAPSIASEPFLVEMMNSLLLPVLLAAPRKLLVVPLGVVVERSILAMTADQKMRASVLRGFPHPSGGNGHRARQFSEQRAKLRDQIRRWQKLRQR